MRVQGICCRIFLLLLPFWCSGCGSEQVAPPTVSAEIATEFAEKEAKELEEKARRDAAPPEYEYKKADVGATGKGEYGVTSEQAASIITVPVSTYFKAQEMSVFRIQIPQALSLFQATEGRYPNSQEEFSEKIIKANMIILPELPQGDEYVYDVESHTLLIRSLRAPE